jgi:ABC-type glutathione transport system ATPase component
VLLVEQFVHMALAHTHRAYVLYKGEVVLEGRSKDIASDPALIAGYLGEAEGGIEDPAAQQASTTRRRRRVATA